MLRFQEKWKKKRMIPLKDDNPTHSFPVITIGLIATNIVAFFYQVSLGPASDQLLFAYGAIPFNLMHTLESEAPIPAIAISLVTSMFLHGSLVHLGGNMLYLWIFGNNIEDVMGKARFVLFYLLCGIIAAYAHAGGYAQSRVPMIGASGAVSGILGAYLLLFPRARILTLVPLGFFMTTMRIPALFFLGGWFFLQVLPGFLMPPGTTDGVGGIAWFAHIGGFLAGISLIYLFKKRRG